VSSQDCLGYTKIIIDKIPNNVNTKSIMPKLITKLRQFLEPLFKISISSVAVFASIVILVISTVTITAYLRQSYAQNMLSKIIQNSDIVGGIEYVRLCNTPGLINGIHVQGKINSNSFKIHRIDLKLYSASQQSLNFWDNEFLSWSHDPRWRNLDTTSYFDNPSNIVFERTIAVTPSTQYSGINPIRLSMHVVTDQGTVYDQGGIIDLGVIKSKECQEYNTN
jgi:hypothetical protein